ncbi:MAG: aminotransferase class I/II-fold pyridoxal phosphate-dependent enzyme, partial [Alphaproteobacteria bacterium]|nr:aminotransferase class I/II-fold pyridoxal phosphate-dependent enzyme [Alphaproteobacteria bacterium]
MPAAFLPYGRQAIDDDDVAAVAAALRGEMLTTGPLVDTFEAEFARAVGAEHAVVCNSGTAALHLATLALGLGPGDVAIVPSVTFLATANCARYVGAEVEFADVDADTGLLGPRQLEEAIARAARRGRPRMVLPVHLNGQAATLGEVAAIARRNGMTVVEDACHALGVDKVGSCAHADAIAFSTHPVKAIATGEGGVLTCADGGVAARARVLRSHGMVREPAEFVHRDAGFEDGQANPWYYEMQEPGWNYRLPDVLCALGISQLAKLGAFHAKRCALADHYDAALAPLANVLRPVPRTAPAAHGWHLYVVLIDFDRIGVRRGEVMRRLRARGIGTQVHYQPVHR